MGRCVSGVRRPSLARLATVIVIALAADGCSSDAAPSQPPQVVATREALWTNGGFESDSVGAVPSNWTVTPNLSTNNTGVTITNPQTVAGLNLRSGGTAAVRVLGGLLTEGQTDPNAPVAYPKYGNRSVVINYVPPGLLGVTAVAGDQRNVNALSQQMVIAAGDVDTDDNQVHVRFVLAPVMGNTANSNPPHTLNQQPYYYIQLQNITQSKLLYSEIEFENQPGLPWTTQGSVVYTNWQLVDIAPGSANLAIGDTVEIRVLAAGCSQSGHAGHVYVDAFGTRIPGLFTSASVAASANAGADLTYTVRYKNGSASSTTNTIVEFVTPPNTTFKSASAGCTGPAIGSAGTVSCNVGTVAAAGSGTVQVTVTIGAAATGTLLQGNYSVRADGVSRLLGSHAFTSILNPDIAVSVSSGMARVGWGQPITYTIVATNSGTGPVTSAALTDAMPAQLSGVTWTCSGSGGATCAASGSGNISDSTLTLPVGGSATYLVHANIIAGSGNGSTTHTASAAITANGVDANGSNNSASETIPIRDVRTLTLSKSASGSVSSAPTGLDCAGGCTSATAPFTDGSSVTFTATAPTNGQFIGWGGACAAAAAMTTCTITISGDQSISANFNGAPASVTVTGGDGQKTGVSTAFANDLDVLVKDAFDQPVSGVNVTFAAPTSGASANLSSAAVATDSSGHAKTTATANGTAGAYNVTASVSGVLNAGPFSLANLGAPVSVAVVSGNHQTIGVSGAAQSPLVVEVRDAANQLLPGVTVMFSAPNSGASGSLSSASVVTDSSGRASVNFTAGNVVGNYNVTASVSGVASNALFMLSNVPSSSTLITISAGNSQTAVVAGAFASALDVHVTDTFGNPVSFAAVSFSVPSAGASAALSAYATSTDANGHAVVNALANTVAGAFSVIASTPGASAPATFDLTNLAGSAANLRVDPGDARQSAKLSTPFAAPLGVEVSDAFGNPVSGANVTYVAPSADPHAALSGGSAKTDKTGHASVTATAGAAAGSYIVTAKLDGGAGQGDFVLTNTDGTTPVIDVVAGSGQSAKIGVAFATALEVVVTLNGTPLAKTPVTFAAPSGGASATFVNTSAITDDSGHASLIATAGTTAGSYIVTANVQSGTKPASFSLTNSAGPPASIVVSPASSPQSAQAGSRFGSPLIVSVFDAKGNPVPGQTVTFGTPSSGARAALDSMTATTDASGQASVGATANGTTGNYLVTAAVSGVAPANFQLQNTSGAPIVIAVFAGSPQTATVNRAFGHTLAVKVTGANNSAITNATVQFSAPSRGATAILSAGSATTNSSGIAEINATAGQTSGDYEVVASIDGAADSARFRLSNTPGDPAMLVASRNATPQSARVNTPYINPLTVHVLDAFGNPVPGASVAFSAPASEPSAKLTNPSPTSNPNGEASVAAIALTKAGAFTVIATVTGTSVIASFQLTNTVGDPVNLWIADGADQTALANQPFGTPLTLRVVDALGNPVSGVTVHISASSNGPTASLSATDVTTDANGQASVDVTANDVPGQFSLTVTVSGAALPAIANFTIDPIPTTCTVNLMPREIATGSDDDIQVVVASDHGTPTGHVEIFVDGVSVGKFDLSAGAVTYTLSGAALGDHAISANYEAEGAFDASQSDPQTLTVAEPGTFDAGVNVSVGVDAGAMPAADGGGGVKAPTGVHAGWRLSGGGCAVGRSLAASALPPSAARPSALLGLLAWLWIARRRRRH